MTPEDLFEQATAWLAEHRAEAPRDYGAILPPELVDDGRRWQRTLLTAGWAGLHWPVEVGGRGLTVEHTASWTRACALAQVPPWINMVGLVLTGGSLLAYGTPEQQATHLPRILDATDVWCQLFSEPGAGSDLASLATRAEQDGDTWVLTGQKVWCSNGRVADLGSAGISLGRRLDELATGISAGSSDLVTQDRLASLLARGRALHALGQRQGAVATVAGSLAKLGVTELLFDLAVLEADLDGAEAMLRGDASARLLEAPGGRIAGGTTQVQKNIIGERILGLPKEP